MPEQLDNQKISSRELMRKTGISRATLNNYIKSGILPNPLVKIITKDQEESTARRLGYFPKWAPDRVAEVKRLKQAGFSMTEIADRFGSASPYAPDDTDQNQRPILPFSPPGASRTRTGPTKSVFLDSDSMEEPALVSLCTMVALWPDLSILEAEFLPRDFLGLVNDLRKSQFPIIEKHHGLLGKATKASLVCYFIDHLDRSYLMDAVYCAIELRRNLTVFDQLRQTKHGLAPDLTINIGLAAGQEYFGTLWSTNSCPDFVALGSSTIQAEHLAAFATNSSIWATKEIISRLDDQELEAIDFGIDYLKHHRGDFSLRSSARISDLLEAYGRDADAFKDIAALPVTEIMGISNGLKNGG